MRGRGANGRPRLGEAAEPVPVFFILAIMRPCSWPHCNARCAFCPNTTVGDDLSQGTMEWDLFRKVADELCAHPLEEIHPFLMNEPLWDKELPEKIRYLADRKQPETQLKINTNASFLTRELGERLLVEGLGVERAGRASHTGDDREGDKR